MNALMTKALRESQFLDCFEARIGGAVPDDATRARLLTADLLVLGSMADELRRTELGDDVRVFANVTAPSDARTIEVPKAATGLEFLRAVALARISSAPGTHVRIDWSKVGLELAQVALGFGADELVGDIANKRGLPIAEDETKKVKGQGMVDVRSLKKKELATLLSYSGRTAVFQGEP